MPIEVPWREVSAETLTNLIEEYVTRDGTDYGEQEVPLTTKVEQVRRLLEGGECKLMFDEATESVDLVMAS
ncbi:YheU family protein [Alcanivorax sp. 24]|uniref:YheU family protein n=1 Tax=Alcanivorax sp. 24 TaxID=2545266 RepID=UPI00105ECC7B|nr:YheU family protein [Alcanivorax sp. 24]